MDRIEFRFVLAPALLTFALAAAGLVTRVWWFAAFVLVAALGTASGAVMVTRKRSAPAAPPESPEPTPAPVPATVEPSEVLNALLQAASGSGDVVAAHLWLEDESTATLRLVSACGPLRPCPDPVPVAHSTLGRALSFGSASIAAEQKQQTPKGERVIWRFAVPLKAGEARGAVGIDIAATDPDRSVLTSAVAGLRSALTGALALHVAREHTRSAHVLLDASRELTRLVDPADVVDALLAKAVELSQAQTGSIMLVGGDGRLRVASSVGLPPDAATVVAAEGEGIAGWVLATKQAVVVEDLEGRGPRSRRHGIRSAVCVPISDDDGILGVLNVGNRSYQARFTRDHRDALETLARVGALALRTARAIETSQELYFDTLQALATAMETKDPYSRGSTARVAELATALAERLHMSEAERTAVRIASLLHDVGMPAAGAGVAGSDRPLSTVEWGLVKVHPHIAAEVLEQAPALREAIPIVFHHHERYDGNGYVLGLSADAIPLGARVLALADAYVAMTSDRPYRAAMGEGEALREVARNAGTQFDPRVVEALFDLLGRSLEDASVPDER